MSMRFDECARLIDLRVRIDPWVAIASKALAVERWPIFHDEIVRLDRVTSGTSAGLMKGRNLLRSLMLANGVSDE